MNLPKSLVKLINKIPGDNGFWRKSTKEAYENVAKKLIDNGINPDEVIGILSVLYSATAEEFGN